MLRILRKTLNTRISSIKILNVKDTNDSDFTVVTQMNLTNQDTINVNYLVRENDGKYKILDIAYRKCQPYNNSPR